MLFLFQRRSGAGGEGIPPLPLLCFLKEKLWEKEMQQEPGSVLYWVPVLLEAVIKTSLCRASRIDPCLDSCSPAEPGFLLGLAPSQLDMMGMKIRAVRAEGCKDRSAPAAVPDASCPAALEQDPPRTRGWGCLEHPSLPTPAPLCPESCQGFVAARAVLVAGL